MIALHTAMDVVGAKCSKTIANAFTKEEMARPKQIKNCALANNYGIWEWQRKSPEKEDEENTCIGKHHECTHDKENCCRGKLFQYKCKCYDVTDEEGNSNERCACENPFTYKMAEWIYDLGKKMDLQKSAFLDTKIAPPIATDVVGAKCSRTSACVFIRKGTALLKQRSKMHLPTSLVPWNDGKGL
ncbi:toxin CSTX-10 [Caerostris extrusa]|uniref:Toxin CSTX-10 n=1 Tax=Caerostris extrusa TaxID=172846 RepID=A0AAV4NQW3_CAEEX|nr:toxin CSTX-10 [Caerostris extrusa]